MQLRHRNSVGVAIIRAFGCPSSGSDNLASANGSVNVQKIRITHPERSNIAIDKRITCCGDVDIDTISCTELSTYD